MGALCLHIRSIGRNDANLTLQENHVLWKKVDDFTTRDQFINTVRKQTQQAMLRLLKRWAQIFIGWTDIIIQHSMVKCDDRLASYCSQVGAIFHHDFVTTTLGLHPFTSQKPASGSGSINGCGFEVDELR